MAIGYLPLAVVRQNLQLLRTSPAQYDFAVATMNYRTSLIILFQKLAHERTYLSLILKEYILT
jgi:hypothetical protein